MITIPRHLWDRIALHCRSDVPDEACGFLAAMRYEPNEIVQVIPVLNVSEHPHARYEVDPREQLAVWESLHTQNQQVRITYHSHLSGDTTLSQTDIRYAQDSKMLHLVLGVQAGQGVVDADLWRVEYAAGVPLAVRLERDVDWAVVGEDGTPEQGKHTAQKES